MTKKIIGLKRAVGEYRRANRNGHLSPEYGYLMFDRSTGELWTDFFSDFGHGSFEEYYDSNIVRIDADMKGLGYNVTMKDVRNYIQSEYPEYE